MICLKTSIYAGYSTSNPNPNYNTFFDNPSAN